MEQSLQVMSKQERLENWTARIMACRSSGMTVRAWCRENGLSEKTYYYWQRRLFDLVARLGVGGIEGAFLLLGHIGDSENPYISLGPKNGKKITLPGSKSSSLGGYFHYLGMITALEDSSNPRDETWWVRL